MISYSLMMIVLAARQSVSYPFGAPSCVDSPKHGLDPQTGEIDIPVFKDVTPEGDIEVTIGDDDSPVTFKGFLIKTKSPGQLECFMFYFN